MDKLRSKGFDIGHGVSNHTMAIQGDFETHLEPIEYLARSPSRLKILESINFGPRTRQELNDSTEVSRVTLSRVLSNFEHRGWIERPNGEYVTTAEGAYVASELSHLLENMRTLQKLDGAMAWLPAEEFDFELRCLHDAEVSTADWGDHTAQIRAVADTIYGSDRIVATGSGVSRDVLDAFETVTVDEGASLEAILDDTALRIVTEDPELRAVSRSLLDAEDVRILRYLGDADPLLMVTICDDTVILCGHDEDGPPPGTLESTNPEVRAWAEHYIATVRRESSPVDPGLFED